MDVAPRPVEVMVHIVVNVFGQGGLVLLLCNQSVLRFSSFDFLPAQGMNTSTLLECRDMYDAEFS